MKRIFYGWYMVGAGCAMQFVQSTLLLQSFGAYFAVLRDDRGWSKTEPFSKPKNLRSEDQIETFLYSFRRLTFGKISAL
jgi:hypothetical protein